MRKEYTEITYLKMIESTNNLKDLMEMLGKGYQEMAVASNILTFARKGKINKLKATLLLRDYPQMIKFLSDKVKVTKIPTRTKKVKKVLDN